MSPTMITIVSSLIYAKKRRTILEVFSPSVRKLWKELELRVMVLLSLSLQILLIFLGNRRKYGEKLWIGIVVWSAYLAADSVATFALGLISKNLGDDEDGAGYQNANNNELTAFWAPFLLLHLGGPDTITAYALEDNQLWLRHLLGLLTQTGVAFNYVIFTSWTGTYLSILSSLMLLVGFIKYGERTWALRSASIEQLSKDIVLKHQFLPEGVGDHLFSVDYEINRMEGYAVCADIITEVQLPVETTFLSEEAHILTAYKLLDTTRRLFLDSVLSSRDRDTTYTLFRSMSFENAFKVIEIQLGFVYDWFYTKTPLLYTSWGLGLRLITFLLTCIVLLLFILFHHSYKYSKVDLSITFLLLVVAIILEICSALVQVSSDRFVVCLSERNKTSNSKTPASIPIFKSPRWSNKMRQFSLLSLCIKEKALPCRSILKLLNIDEKLEKHWYVSSKDVTEDLKKLIFRFVKTKALGDETPFAAIYHAKPIAIKKEDDPDRDLGQSVVSLHIVTELLYYKHKEAIGRTVNILEHCKLIKRISRYMLYLLINYPSMLSADQNSPTLFHVKGLLGEAQVSSKSQAWEELMKEFNSRDKRDLPPMSMLPRVLDDLDNFRIQNEEEILEKWEEISLKWLKLLVFAAGGCKGNHHAQQLRRGGELITHVWLLMAHFGLTHHFQITEPQTIDRILRI